MNYFKKLPHSPKYASGLEWRLWKKLPLIALLGTAVPALVLALVHFTADEQPTADHQRWLNMFNYMVMGLIGFHWTAVFTIGFGCLIVMVMKGPGYVADGYPVSHSDQPQSKPD